MTDKEREALRNFKSEYETCDHYSSDLIVELDDAEIILNLIENQQKEIEELKKPRYLYNAHTGKITKLENFNCISKDKIKAKIEEYKRIGEKEIEVNTLQELLEE